VPIGTNPDVAQEILRGVAQAQTQLNDDGGIEGRPVQVLIGNDNNDKKLSEGLAQHFVQDPSILAVIGHNASRASEAAAPIYAKGELVMITPTSFSNNLSSWGPYIFRMVSGIPLAAEVVVDQIANSKTIPNPRIAICAAANADGTTYVHYVEQYLDRRELQQANIHLVNDVDCDFSKPGFNADRTIQLLQAQGVNTMLLVPYIDNIDSAINFAKATQGKFELFGSPTFDTTKTTKRGKDVNGLVIAVPWHPTRALDSTFATEAQRRWGLLPNWRSVMAADSLKTISVGLQQSIRNPQGLPLRQALQTVLRAPNFVTTGASDKIQFSPSTGERRLSKGVGALLKLQPVNASAYGYDFVAQASSPASNPGAPPQTVSSKTGSSAAPLAAPSPVRK
jgi:branched-chain amino acid transport system substrate-binding protein